MDVGSQLGPNAMNLAALDLNLLVVFEALLLERGVGRAGKRIGLSQPAVSNALGRLRAALGDALFVRNGAIMVPTARAMQLSAPILDALNRIRAAIGSRIEFDPSTAEVRFRIQTSDYGETLILAPLLGRIEALAPKVTFQIRRAAGLFLPPIEELTADVIDCSIGFFPDVLPPGSGVMSEVLMQDRVAVLSSPKRRRKLTLDDFVQSPQIRVNVGRESSGLIDDALARRGLSRRIALTLPDFSTIPWVVARTDLIGVIPERLGRLFARQFGLRVHPLPLDVPPLNVHAAWHQRNHGHPAHMWLRRELLQLTAVQRRSTSFTR